MRARFRLLAASAVLVAVAGAQDEAATKPAVVDDLLAPIRERHDVTALAACVLRGDEVIAIGAVGHRRRGAEAKVTVDDLWHLGSCTKAMTATLCGMLIDEGRLKLDAGLPELLPDLAGRMHADWKHVTLRDLLRHRAGLMPNPMVDGLWAEMSRFDGPLPEMRAAIAEAMLTRAPSGARGTYVYSNTGYILVGAVLERVTGRPWEDLMRERLFTPLHMTSAGFGAPGVRGELDQPLGHLRGTHVVPVEPGPAADNPAALGPAGTVHASLRDWAKFIALQIGADRHQPPLVSARTLAALRELPEGGDYACGFAVTTRPWAHGPVLTHTGSNLRWFCVVWCAPDDHFAVLALCNEGGDPAAKATDEACAALIERFGPKVKTDK